MNGLVIVLISPLIYANIVSKKEKYLICKARRQVILIGDVAGTDTKAIEIYRCTGYHDKDVASRNSMCIATDANIVHISSDGPVYNHTVCKMRCVCNKNKHCTIDSNFNFTDLCPHGLRWNRGNCKCEPNCPDCSKKKKRDAKIIKSTSITKTDERLYEDVKCKPRPIELIRVDEDSGYISKYFSIHACFGFGSEHEHKRRNFKCVPTNTEQIILTGRMFVNHTECAVKCVCSLDGEHCTPENEYQYTVPCPPCMRWCKETCQCVKDNCDESYHHIVGYSNVVEDTRYRSNLIHNDVLCRPRPVAMQVRSMSRFKNHYEKHSLTVHACSGNDVYNSDYMCVPTKSRTLIYQGTFFVNHTKCEMKCVCDVDNRCPIVDRFHGKIPCPPNTRWNKNSCRCDVVRLRRVADIQNRLDRLRTLRRSQGIRYVSRQPHRPLYRDRHIGDNS